MIACFRLQDSGKKSFSKEVLKKCGKRAVAGERQGGEFVACEQETYFRLSLRLVKLETRAEKNGRSHRITNLKT